MRSYFDGFYFEKRITVEIWKVLRMRHSNGLEERNGRERRRGRRGGKKKINDPAESLSPSYSPFWLMTEVITHLT